MRESGRTKAMLCELMIVALFLALSSMTLLRLFAASNAISRESEALSCATILAQDALERLRAGEELPQETARVVDGETYLIVTGTEAEPSAAGVLYTYRVRVLKNERTLTAMETARYCPQGSAL